MTTLKKGLLHLVACCLVTTPALFTPAYAGVVSTDAAIAYDERQVRIDNVQRALARDDVRATLERLGVNPADAATRVAALTDAELATLEQRVEELPAGGTSVIAVIGIVAVVLLILELLGVTNVFTKI